MGAFSIAFDIIIVGALALPAVLLVIHLFFSDHESSLKKLLDWVKEQEQPALAGVLLFAMAFPLGSAVSRLAQDFFDDSDLHLHVHLKTADYERWFRLPVATETNIRADTFCEVQEQIQKLPSTQSAGNSLLCADASGALVPKTKDLWQQRQRLEALADRVFRIQEAALLLLGTDSNERLRQFHDQIVVLRGAAFNGMIALFLCLFWWMARFKSRLRWIFPLAVFLLGINALFNHLVERGASDPPYMEFTLLVLAAAGGHIMWPHAPPRAAAPEEPPIQNGRGRIKIAYLLLAAFLTTSAFLGWWSTQVLYDQQVFYSYQALLQNLKPAAPSK